MIANPGRIAKGLAPARGRCIHRKPGRHDVDYFTHAGARGKARPAADNPGRPAAAACTDPAAALDCGPAIFEVRNPSAVQTPMGLAWIVSALGKPQTSLELDRTPHHASHEGSAS